MTPRGPRQPFCKDFMIRFRRDPNDGGDHGREGNSRKEVCPALSDGEREQLATLIRKGSSPAQRLLKARILLKADISEAGEGWSEEAGERESRVSARAALSWRAADNDPRGW